MEEADRHSKASEAELITDPEEKARREAQNGVRQFDRAIEMIDYWLHPERPFKLSPSAMLTLNGLALEGLSAYAGNYRPSGIGIGGSKHTPPASYLVPELVEELCDHVNANWNRTPLYLASYVLWRLNWIHPFADGNGRTSRTISFVVLCARLGYRVPGSPTIPEQISNDKSPYYKALEKADAIFEKEKKVDVGAMESLVGDLLAIQLSTIIRDARVGQQ
jgi:Fic family protein